MIKLYNFCLLYTSTIMTLAAANTLGIQVSLPAAIVLSAMSALGALSLIHI